MRPLILKIGTDKMKCLVVGHLVKDVIVKGSGIEYRIGGGAYYSALALSRFCDVEVLTSVGEDFPGKWLEELEASGIRLHVIPSRNSTSYRLRYLDRDNRELTLLSVAERITDFPKKGYDMILLNPVAGEVPPESIELARERSSFVGADVQGFIRPPEPGRVKLKDIDGSVFRGVKVLHGEASEMTLVKGIEPGDVEVLLVSQGGDEGTAYLRGRKHVYRPVKVAVDESTGAGDVFLASFSYFYRECPFVQALKRAAAFTALFLKHRHFSFPLEEVNELAREVDVKPARQASGI
ncbi:carbohydrate kinase [Thermococcus sp. MV11]|nr:carbohydrate kinase [Thermococcus sp. MV11]